MASKSIALDIDANPNVNCKGLCECKVLFLFNKGYENIQPTWSSPQWCKVGGGGDSILMSPSQLGSRIQPVAYE